MCERGSRDVVDLLAECHERIRGFVALAREAGSRIDAPVDQVVRACAQVERYFVLALPLHVADEEESIEPRLRGASPLVDRALDVMADQHQHHEPKLHALLRATAKVRSKPNDRVARRELVAAATVLGELLEEHLVLEEDVILPAIRQHLPHTTQRAIVEEIRQRRLAEQA
ncbi:MAG: hemerythrin domain-containing protein [Myxococcales bacterium]|nr:hemerythrin domain-containing protein [Myxococcales bacterium]